MKVCPTLTSLGLAFAIAAPAATATATGQSRLENLITQSIENLSKTELRLGALQRLENLGKLAVPELRKRLVRQTRGDLTRQQQADLLWLLGVLGEHGVVALPELFAWLGEADNVAIDPLMRTLTDLAPHLDQQQLDQLQKEVHQYRSAKYRGAFHAVRLLNAQVELSAQPSTTHLVAHLRADAARITAACRRICAKPNMAAEGAQQLAEVLHERLSTVAERSFISLGRNTTPLSGELAAAWLAISGRAPDAIVARGLLTHRRPMQRLRGILWLGESGSELTVEERCDIAVRLWDGDDRVAAAAATALGRWRKQASFALPPLMLMAEQHTSTSVKLANKAAVQQITTDFETAASEDQPWLLGALAILNGQPATAPAEAPSQAGKRKLAEMMIMAKWNPPKRLAHLLTFLQASKPDRLLVGSVYGWLGNQDAPVIDTTLAFLARNAKHTIDIADEVRQDDPGSRWLRFTLHDVPRTCRGTSIEATAWFESAEATPKAFLNMLDSRNTRLQARGLAELLLLPTEHLQPVTARLRELANLHGEQQLHLRHSAFKLAQPYLLSEPVRMLAVMALARMGRVAKQENVLSQLVKKHFTCSLEDLPTIIALREQAGEMVDQIEVFEAMCRRALFVPPQLAWPKAKQGH